MTTTSITRILILCLVLVLGGFGIMHLQRDPPVATAPAVSSSAPDAQGTTTVAKVQAEADAVAAALGGSGRSPAAGGQSVPAFDVARIENTGDAVIAGRAVPGATVELLRDGAVQDRAVADRSGQFAMVPPRLPAGNYELTLRSTQPDGKQATSNQSVAVVLQPNLKEQPVVALMTPDKPTVVLSKPAAGKPIGGRVAVDTVEMAPNGKLQVSGRSPAGAAVRLYLNDSYLASTTAAADGRFAFTVDGGVGPGNYRVRLDEVESGSGTVRSRAEVPFNVPQTVATSRSAPTGSVGSEQTRLAAKPPGVVASQEPTTTATTPLSAAASPSAVVVPKIATTVVSRGDNLWRISRNTYGNGRRYAVIYQANHDQIRNPNRIYPGQIFVLPETTR